MSNLPWSVRRQQLLQLSKSSAPVVAGVTLLIIGAEVQAAETYDISEPVSDIQAGKAPVGAASAATMGLLGVRRVWRIIRSSI